METRKIRFYFRGGGINSKVEEFVHFSVTTTDEEINEDFSTWLWETSDANWSEE